MRDVLLFLHILGAAGWIGGGFAFLFIFSRLTRAGEAGVGQSIETVLKGGGWYFGPVSGLVLLTGIGLVLTSEPYGWTDAFVLMGIGGFVLSGVWQSVARKTETRFVEAVKEGGTGRIAALRGWQRTASVDFVILLVVLWAMIVKLGA